METVKSMDRIQTSESLRLGAVLAFAGGFMDAYSYLLRGGVFANAETGNMVLFAINIANFKWIKAFGYLLPILAFAIGIVITALVRRGNTNLISFEEVIHWRQFAVSIEIIIMILVVFIPQNLNILANSLISLACGIQLSAFAKFYGYPMATTMCTGNLRKGTESLNKYFMTKESHSLRISLLYYGCIMCFMIGAMVGNRAVKILGYRAPFVISLCLALALLMMFFEESRKLRLKQET